MVESQHSDPVQTEPCEFEKEKKMKSEQTKLK